MSYLQTKFSVNQVFNSILGLQGWPGSDVV